MKAATRRKVSYVVKLCNEEQTHCLGVNSLAIDTSHYNTANNEGGVLYSAGRDGIVASWDLHLKVAKDTKDKWRLDGQAQVYLNIYNGKKQKYISKNMSIRPQFPRPHVRLFHKCIQIGSTILFCVKVEPVVIQTKFIFFK